MTYNKKDIWIGKSFEMYGEFSESEVEYFRKILKPGDTVIDVGANIGAHTVVFSRLVTNSGLVIALEPERLNFYTLCSNISINNLTNVFCFQQALSETAGVIQVPVLDYNKTVNFGGLELDKDYSSSPHYPVPQTRLNDIGINACNLIKIDVEGMERQVLLGGQDLIKKYRPILWVENDRKEKEVELINLINSMNYLMYQIDLPLFNKNNYYGLEDNLFGGNVCSRQLLCLPKENKYDFIDNLISIN